MRAAVNDLSIYFQALAQIAVIELPTGEFGNVIPHLVQGIQSTNANTTARAAAIVCLGYICDEAVRSMLSCLREVFSHETFSVAQCRILI